MRFIAVREESGATTIAILSCSDETDFSGSKDFFDKLKDAVTNWVANNEIGKQVWADSCEDLNFGDLALCSDNAELINILGKHGIFNFDIQVVSTNESSFSFDSLLVNTDNLSHEEL